MESLIRVRPVLEVPWESVIRFCPPLTIERGEIDTALGIMDRVLEAGGAV